MITIASCGSYLIGVKEQLVLSQGPRLKVSQKWSQQHQQWQYVLPTDPQGNEIYFNGSINEFLIWLLLISPNPEVVNQNKKLFQNLIKNGFYQGANDLANLVSRVENQLFNQVVNNNHYWHWKQLLNYETSALEVYWQDYSGLHIRQNEGENSLEAILNRFLKNKDQIPDANDFLKLKQLDWESDYFIWLKLDLIASARWVINGQKQQSVEFVFHIKDDGNYDLKPTDGTLDLALINNLKNQSAFLELNSKQQLTNNKVHLWKQVLENLKDFEGLVKLVRQAKDSILNQNQNQPDLKLIKDLKHAFLAYFLKMVVDANGQTISLDSWNQGLLPLLKTENLNQILNLKMRLKINDGTVGAWVNLISEQTLWEQSAQDLINQIDFITNDWNFSSPINVNNKIEIEWQMGFVKNNSDAKRLQIVNELGGVDQDQQPILKAVLKYVPTFVIFTNDQKSEQVAILDPNLLIWNQTINKGVYEK